MQIEDLEQFVIVNKETQELYTSEVFLSKTGAKTSWLHSERRKNWMRNAHARFDEQDVYEIVKVKLVRV